MGLGGFNNVPAIVLFNDPFSWNALLVQAFDCARRVCISRDFAKLDQVEIAFFADVFSGDNVSGHDGDCLGLVRRRRLEALGEIRRPDAQPS